MAGTGQVLFVQGGGAGAHDEWDHKLVETLSRQLWPDYEVRYPRMPDEDEPTYSGWCMAIRREMKALHDGAVVVGHSLGGTILVNALAEEPANRELGAIALVAAPFVGTGGWPGDEFETPQNLGARLPEGVPVHVFQGVQDQTTPPSHADLYIRVIPQAHLHRLPGRDHQLNDDLSDVARMITSHDPAVIPRG
jgi:predicted alpha/beta hydrolase family esterase